MSDEETALLALINLPVLPASFDAQAYYQRLSVAVAHLIDTDFPRLIEILYRVDVDEQKLKKALSDGDPKNSADIIATLLLERQKQKLALRNRFSSERKDIPDEESW